MGKREHYDPGTFCWVDLATTDSAGAKEFYGGLFGWKAEDLPATEGGMYTILSLDGDEVCGLYELEAGRREAGVPSHWLSYVSVENADEAMARALELGGTVCGEAWDARLEGRVVGRMAVLQDPTGAVLAVWEPRAHVGAGRVNDPGCLTLNQLNTRDPERAAGFYKDLFGWEVAQVSGDPPYWGISNKGWLNGGMMESPGGAPSHWFGYFVSEDLEAAAGSIEKFGGTVLVPPMSVSPEGRILAAQDPQGAAFALFEGETDE